MVPSQDPNPRPVNRKCDALPIAKPCHLSLLIILVKTRRLVSALPSQAFPSVLVAFCLTIFVILQLIFRNIHVLHCQLVIGLFSNIVHASVV